jgi:sulfur-carrier protein adenylyltransferase/sulfurtransferase
MSDSPNISRYHRQIILPEIGQQGQQKISTAKVLVVGAGALGSAVLQYLVPAGVGTVGVLDHDELELTNLHRQVLYSQDDVGHPKVLAAIKRLKMVNSDIRLVPHFLRLQVNNALDIITPYDLIIECSDNFPTKFLVNDACVMLNKPCIIGAAMGFSGQLSVYNYQEGPTYRCLMPEPPDPLTLPTCANAGVMGMVPGIIGNMQALEAIKIITGAGTTLSGRLLHYDALEANFIEIPIDPIPGNKNIIQLTDYEYSCPDQLLRSHTVVPQAFFPFIQDASSCQVIALSDDQEFLSVKEYQWKTIPLYKLPEAVAQVPTGKKIMLVCENGIKNFDALKYLLVKEKNFRSYALKDGLAALRIMGLV